MGSQSRGHVLSPHRISNEKRWVKSDMHVTSYAKLLFFVSNLLSLIISATDVLCLERLKPDLMVRVWERRKSTG